MVGVDWLQAKTKDVSHVVIALQGLLSMYVVLARDSVNTPRNTLLQW